MIWTFDARHRQIPGLANATPKAFANVSPGLSLHSDNPGSSHARYELNPERVRRERNPFRVDFLFNNLDPRVVAALQLRAEISQRLRRTFANTAVVQSKCLRKRWLREKESNLHFRGQSPRCYRLHYPALLVDPTRLKRAPHRLKGGCSVPRAPGQEMAVAEGFEPSMAALTVRCLTNLATPQSGGYGWTRTPNLALIGRLLCVELHSLASRNVDGA